MASTEMVHSPTDADIGFCQDMASHHDQAILMARIARSQTADPTIATLASAIQESQLVETGQLRGFLQLWGAAQLPSGQAMRWMPASDHEGHDELNDGAQHADPSAPMAMPGMATEAELTTLRQATGTGFDVFFLQLMLRHHQGALPMLTVAAERAAVPAVRNLAQQMSFHQTDEAATLVSLLRLRGAAPLSA